jgi:hypothetical protein
MAAPVPITPRRLVILAAGVPLLLVLIAFGAHGFVRLTVLAVADRNQIGYKVTLSVPVSDRHVSLTVDNADVSIRPGAVRRIEVRGYLEGAVDRPTFSHRLTAGGLTLNPQCPFPMGNCSLALTVTVPAGLPVTAHGQFSNLNARSLRGPVELSENSGDLTAARLTGRIQLSDAGANIDATGLAGSIRVSNSSGDITAANVTGDVQLQDSFGNITVTGLAASDVTASNNSGDITLTFRTVPRRVSVTDSFGNVTLLLPRGPALYQIHTPPPTSGNSLITVPNTPSASHVITVHNGNGDITITQLPLPGQQSSTAP